MLLIITNSGDRTADYVEQKLCSRSIPRVRLDTDRVAASVSLSHSRGLTQLRVFGTVLTPDQVVGVWFRRPKPILISHVSDSTEIAHLQAEWAEALEGFFAQIPSMRWINYPAANVVASHKIEQLSRATSLGLNVPETVVTQSPQELRDIWDTTDGRLICKPLASGFLDRESHGQSTVIYTNQVHAHHLLKAEILYTCPTLFQERIEKSLDVRVCVVDEAVEAVGLRAQDREGKQRLDIRRNNMSDVIHGQVDVPGYVSARLVDLVKSYGLRFSAIDMVIDKIGEWFFLELNPNGQWAWLDQVEACNVGDLLVEALLSPKM